MLNTRLSIVEIAAHGCNTDVIAGLRYHLELLDIGNAVMRIEHKDFCVFNIRKALKCRLACVAACCDKDADLAPLTAFFSEAVSKCGSI